MASQSGGEVRPWWTSINAGVAVASSVLTLVSVLGYQRIHRRRMRHDLEQDIRRSTRKGDGRAAELQAKGASTSSRQDIAGAKEGKGQAEGEGTPVETVPRYLAVLASAHDGQPMSRTQSPRPTGGHRKVSRPSASASNASSNPVSRSNTMQGAVNGAGAPNGAGYDESLIREQLSRNYSFLGDEAMAKLRDAFVIVVGAGGVGSWCALMLLRSGVGHLRLIDFDQVSLSSLNRHACANLADVGRPKVEVCKAHFAAIAPWCQVDARVDIFRATEADRLLAGVATTTTQDGDKPSRPTFVIDCIDNLDTKVDLLAYCYHHKIPCFSSMGAGAKSDPSQIQVADLNMTAEDPLARRVRRGLRAKGIWGGGVLAKKRVEDRTRKDARPKAGPKQKQERQKEEGTSAKAFIIEENQDTADETKRLNREEALKKLESNEGKSPATPVKRLQHSGRGAQEDFSKRNSLLVTPSISRRPSSNSSVSSAYFSPMSSPADERQDPLQEDNGGRTFRLSVNGEPVEGMSLPEPAEEEAATTSSDPQPVEPPSRPALATYTGSDDRDSFRSSYDAARRSRRTASLQELAAEEVRSTLKGRRTSSRGPLHSHLEEEEEEASHDEGKATPPVEDEQAGENPYTIMCVYTNEKSDTRLLPLDEEEFQKGSVDELAALEDFRVRILPVLGPLPAMFGLAAATYVICQVAGRTMEPLPFKNRRKTAERLWNELENAERRFPSPGSKLTAADRAIGPRRIPWTLEDVQYIFEEVYRCRSVVPPHETLSLCRVLRWDATLPLSYSNVAVFSRDQGRRHEEEVLKNGRSPVEVWGEDTLRMFKRRMADERRMNILR